MSVIKLIDSILVKASTFACSILPVFAYNGPGAESFLGATPKISPVSVAGLYCVKVVFVVLSLLAPRLMVA